MEPGTRFRSLDLVRGVAIIGVILIHSRALEGSRIMLYGFDRAVPIFVILLGTTSTLWWNKQERTVGGWYRNRARRVLPPMWTTLALWWCLLLWLGPGLIEPSWSLLGLTVAGYWKGIGTGWFVTLILQLVVIMPLLHLLVRRFDLGPVLAVGFALSVLCVVFRPELIAEIGWFNTLVFTPRFFGHVLYGMLLARFLGKLGSGGLAMGLAGILPLALVLEGGDPGLERYAISLLPFPLAVLLLSATELAGERVRYLTTPLAYLGSSSLGIYLGQCLVLSGLMFWFGLSELYDMSRWLIMFLLLAGGMGLTWLGGVLDLYVLAPILATVAGHNIRGPASPPP